jgi:phosphatidylinositol-3-phosphatase
VHRSLRAATVALAALAALALAGCTAPAPAAPSTARASAPASTSAASAGLQHVVVLVLENKPSSRILSSPEAPYLNALARRSAVATNYSAIRHPSLPNYLAMTSGTTAGVTSDCDPDACGASVRTIAGEITASGRSWRMYAEAMPAPCTLHDAGRYAVRHNPFLYDSDITGDAAGCAEHDVPYSRLATDLKRGTLPDLAFISPDLCNDMHDCSVATGDSWLAREVPKILGAGAFRDSRSLLVVTFDEGVREQNTVATVLAGPAARAGARSARPYTHYSLLRTIEDAWHLAPLAKGDAAATPMSDLLR